MKFSTIHWPLYISGLTLQIIFMANALETEKATDQETGVHPLQSTLTEEAMQHLSLAKETVEDKVLLLKKIQAFAQDKPDQFAEFINEFIAIVQNQYNDQLKKAILQNTKDYPSYLHKQLSELPHDEIKHILAQAIKAFPVYTDNIIAESLKHNPRMQFPETQKTSNDRFINLIKDNPWLLKTKAPELHECLEKLLREGSKHVAALHQASEDYEIEKGYGPRIEKAIQEQLAPYEQFHNNSSWYRAIGGTVVTTALITSCICMRIAKMLYPNNS